MKIKVTKNDIKNGLRKSCCKCPVALALKRQTEYKKIFIGAWFFDLDGKIVSVPESVRNFIVKFDREFDVEPFSFTLKLTNCYK